MRKFKNSKTFDTKIDSGTGRIIDEIKSAELLLSKGKGRNVHYILK